MLKLLACVSAIALAYPAAAQVAGEVQSDSTAGIASDGVTGPVDATLDTAAEGVVESNDAAAMDSVDTSMTGATEAEPGADAAVAANAAVAAEAQPEPATEATADAGVANEPAQVAAFVDQEFGNFDGDADGELSSQEFAAWLVPLQAQQGNQTEAELNLWAQGAFAQADTDSSASVSASEMTDFLAG